MKALSDLVLHEMIQVVEELSRSKALDNESRTVRQR